MDHRRVRLRGPGGRCGPARAPWAPLVAGGHVRGGRGGRIRLHRRADQVGRRLRGHGLGAAVGALADLRARACAGWVRCSWPRTPSTPAPSPPRRPRWSSSTRWRAWPLGIGLFGDNLRTYGAYGPLEAFSLLIMFVGADLPGPVIVDLGGQGRGRAVQRAVVPAVPVPAIGRGRPGPAPTRCRPASRASSDARRPHPRSLRSDMNAGTRDRPRPRAGAGPDRTGGGRAGAHLSAARGDDPTGLRGVVRRRGSGQGIGSRWSTWAVRCRSRRSWPPPAWARPRPR